MTQIPRKPTFPQYMVQKLINKIQNEVEDDVIPVSTGIYSYQKLNEKLESIEKPQIENYQDRIFFQIIEDKIGVDKTGQKCPSCQQQYNLKRNPAVMCNFCGIYVCLRCKPGRQRPHPLSKDGSGKRYNICVACDNKYLNLQLNHSYVQNRSLLQHAIVKISTQLQNVMNESQQYQQMFAKSKQSFQKNKFKISQLRKQKLQLTKSVVNKLPQDIKAMQERNQTLQSQFMRIHLKHKQWLEFHEVRKKEREQKQRELRYMRQRQEQQKRRKQQKQRVRRQIEQMQREQQRKKQEYERWQQQNSRKNRQNTNKNLSYKNSAYSMNINNTNYDSNNDYQRQYSSQANTISNRISHDFNKNMHAHYNQQENRQQQNVKFHHQQQDHQNTYQNSQKQESKPKHQQVEIQIPVTLTQQQQQFANYFLEQNHQYNTEYYRNQYDDTPVKLLYNQQNSAQKEQQQKPQPFVEQQTIQIKPPQINTFSFSDSRIQRLYPQRKNSYYEQIYQKNQRKKSQDIKVDQYTFSKQKGIKSQEQITEQIISSLNQENSGQNNIEQRSTSFNQQWYLNRDSKINSKQPSTMESVLSRQQQSIKNNKKFQQQLQQDCNKSTSQLDENELEVARYSLIKAARDKAVQQRQRNKVYQQSMHRSPEQFEQETIGQVKKCQCTIY